MIRAAMPSPPADDAVPTADAPVIVPAALPAPRPEVTPDAPRHLGVAPEPARRRRLTGFAVAAGLLATVLSLFVIVAANVVMAQQSFELDTIRERQQLAQRRNATLRADVARLSSPSRIIDEAKKLGMVPAHDFGFVESDGAVDARRPGDEVAETLQDTAHEARDAYGDTAP
jgi:hypothetical protein